jgi:tetratricopeptide (TPR) repeat protein
MLNMDSETLQQLTQIKWLLVGFLAVVVFRVCVAIWTEVMKLGGFHPSKLLRSSFLEEARGLLEAGENAKALLVAERRIEEAPGDAHGFWFHATAAYRVGNMPAALRSLRKVAELQPDWGITHVQPFIQAIEAQTSPHGQKADLRVLTPNPASNPDAPPAEFGGPRPPSGGGSPVN